MINKVTFIILVLLVVFGTACTEKNNHQQSVDEHRTDNHNEESQTEVTLTDAQMKNTQIETTQCGYSQIEEIIQFQGVVDVPPQSLISVTFPMNGTISSTTMLPGTFVKKGALIARIEDPMFLELQQEYLITMLEREQFSKEAKRQKNLSEVDATSKRQFEETSSKESQLLVKESTLRKKLQLLGIKTSNLRAENISSKISIFAPITGYITEVHCNIGMYMLQGQPLFEIVDPTHIHGSLTIFEKDIDKIKIGQHVKIVVPSLVHDTIDAEIVLISKAIKTDRSSTIHCHFKKIDEHLLPGMFLRGFVVNSGITVPSIHESAIVRFENKTYIFEKTKKSTYKLQEITIVSEQNSIVYFTSNVTTDNKVYVTKGSFTLVSVLKNTDSDQSH